jgi:hypothetical protein
LELDKFIAKRVVWCIDRLVSLMLARGRKEIWMRVLVGIGWAIRHQRASVHVPLLLRPADLGLTGTSVNCRRSEI